MPTTTSESSTEEITGHVFGKSDVETREDLPVEVFVVAIPEAQFDTLRRDVEDSGKLSGEIVNVKGTVPKPFTAYASGHDVSGQDGRYEIRVEESGLHFLCLTGETDVPEDDSWRVAGCMRIEVPEGETVEQDLYMQFGRLVSPR